MNRAAKFNGNIGGSSLLMAAVVLIALLLTPGVNYAQAKTVKTIGKAVDTPMVRQLFFSAIAEKTAEDNKQAAEMFNHILQIDPANDASMYELAGIEKIQKDYPGAQALLEKAVSLKPNNEWYWVALADSYEKTNDLPKIENVFQQLIRINPEKPEYYFDSANAFFFEKKYDEALKVYDKLEKITGPTDELMVNRQKIYLKQGKIDQAAAGLEELISNNPNQVKYYLLLAEIYNSNGMNDKALKALERAKKVAPDNGMIHLALADIYRDKKNKDAAFNELTAAFSAPDVDVDQKVRIIMGYVPQFPDANAKASALQLSKLLVQTSPNDAKANALYGDMLLQNEKLTEAKAAYQKSIALNGQIYEVREQLARIELTMNDMDGVIRDGEDALSYFPNQAWMNYFVGIALVQKKEYQKALSYLKNTISLESQDKQLLSLGYSALGDDYHELKDSKASDEAYDKSLGYNGDNVYTLNNYAYYLSVRGEQLDKAAQMSKRANELQPGTASFEDTYAWILFKQKKYTDAKIWINKAIADDKTKSATQAEHAGDIMFQLGDVDGAVSNWKKAKTYGAQSPLLDRKINEKKYIE